MSRTGLIILGAALLLLLILLLLCRLPNLKAAVGRMNGIVALVLGLLLAGAVAWIAVKVFVPAGTDELLSESVEGTLSGDAEEDLQIRESEKETGGGFLLSDALSGNEEGDETVYLTVSGSSFRIGNVNFADMAGLADAVRSLKEQKVRICLVDDYALAKTWHGVKEILDSAGISYTETEKQ